MKNAGIGRSLVALIDEAERARASGTVEAAAGGLSALLREAAALEAREVSAGDAARLFTCIREVAAWEGIRLTR